ncbi:hypothetical protein [Haloferula sp. A504]|uniref:hypothetical protein n=1 Tax=Haloferula sp. A504 TaxID=3373601 RepID=UPI0031C7736D|nr:hypothetical protein [Verrucomicrobiaceae bacterium E54]
MAIKLIANYSKRLGLPGYSSHQFSVSVETELVAIDNVPDEAERIYHLLQTNVDEQIKATGFVPPGDYGMDDAPASSNGTNGTARAISNWHCSDKQRDLILKLVDEHSLDKDEVDHLARQRFGKGVKQLNKMEASGLIDELLETHGGGNGKARSNGTRRNAYARNGGGR